MINYRGEERERHGDLGRLDAAAARGSVILIGVIYIAVKTVDTPGLSWPRHAESPCLFAQLETPRLGIVGSIPRLRHPTMSEGETRERGFSRESRWEPSCRFDVN